MKRVQGYLIDRETGVGISGKTVSFENLAGAAITTATTYAQAVDAVTDADGKFEAWFELSPGPVNIQVDVSGTEVKVRKHDEMAQFGAVWSSDIGRLGRVIPDGVIDGFLNELAVTTPSGHNIVIATGAAIIRGSVFSIENGPMTIVGTANTNPAINPRLDLVTLRQHHETAAGQNSGRQEVVVTLGTSSDVAPATPTGADFTDLPLAVVSTAYNAPSKTLDEDLREFSNVSPAPILLQEEFPSGTPAVTTSFVTFHTADVEGLDAGKIYDGYITVRAVVNYDLAARGPEQVFVKFDSPYIWEGDPSLDHMFSQLYIQREGDAISVGFLYGTVQEISLPIVGVTGLSTLSIPIQFRKLGSFTAGTVNVWEPGNIIVFLEER